MQPKRHRLWVLSELYYPEDSATGFYVTKTAEALAATHEVSVLCAQPTYRARGTKAPAFEVLNQVRVHRCAATTLNKDVLSFRIVNLITISVSLFFNAVRKIRQGDVVIVVTNPPTLPFVAFLACKLRGAKLILRIEDVYPDAMIAAGMVRSGSPAVRVLNAMHRSLYRNVDRVIVLGRDMLQLVQRKLQRDSRNVTVITNWADCAEITPLDRDGNPLLKKLGLTNKFVVQYSGNMGRTHDLEGLVQAARILAPEQGIHFLFIGTGAKEVWLTRTTRELALGNVTILPPQQRSDLAQSLNACDLAVISFVKGMAGVSVPSRMYNILAAGKPILAVADSDSELALVVREERVGWLVQPASPEKTADAILEAFANPAQLSEMSKRARALVLRSYTQSQIIVKFEELLENVTSLSNHGSGGRS
jgi:glycosyltransferase involved in cell wall biosynthesis